MLLDCIISCYAFLQSTTLLAFHPRFQQVSTYTTSTSHVHSTVQELADRIEACVTAGKKPDEFIEQLEKVQQSLENPNRSKGFLGKWNVWYTDCPPPSNGKLGPFQGTAGQVIESSDTKLYQNLLTVPPSNWLTATLDGVWEEWDGALLMDKGEETPTIMAADELTKHVDWGATHWKVTFQRLRIAVFGLSIVNKDFPPETARVWRTTYLDDNIRIVRAGKTGRVQDEVVFYTKRTPPPEGWAPN